MNRSYSKIRHIQKSNVLLETRLVKRIIKESESKPNKIEIEFLPDWEDKLNKMKDYDDAGNARGHTPYNPTVELYANGKINGN